MTIRKAAIALAITCSALLAGPVAANAAPTTGTSLKNIHVTGKTQHGKKFNGHFTVTQFTNHNGKAFALGMLTGKLGNKDVKKQVSMLARVGSAATTAGASVTCPVLHLVLGPLNLNLLGLQVTLNQVNLNINAISGAGNLLGNLLCDVANLLNQQNPLTAGQTAGLLGIFQSASGQPGVLSF